MQNLKEKIEDMAHYDQCAHVPPLFFAQILEALRVLAEATELTEFMSTGRILPKITGPFTFQGYPCHSICIEHSGTMYLVFCSYHNGTSGISGSNYILFQFNSGSFKYNTYYSSTTVPDWVKRSFGEATATASYPGIMSNTMYKRLDAVYQWCVSQGMNPVT